MLAALGFTFTDADGRQLRACGRTLHQVHTVDSSRAVNRSGIEIVIAGDVTNPLTGPSGAAAVYGPQKGADPATVRELDAGLDNLVDAFTRSGHPQARAVANSPGAGGAGGIGFAAMMLGARMVSGAEYFLDLLDFDGHLAGMDLVITGEGSIDEQTEHGKLLAVLARRAHPVPVIAVAGRNTLSRNRWAPTGFEYVHSLGDYTDRNTATDPELTGELLTRSGGHRPQLTSSTTKDHDDSHRSPFATRRRCRRGVAAVAAEGEDRVHARAGHRHGRAHPHSRRNRDGHRPTELQSRRPHRPRSQLPARPRRSRQHGPSRRNPRGPAGTEDPPRPLSHGGAVWATGEQVRITVEDCAGTHHRVSTTYTHLAQDARPGDRLLVDDGKIALTVLDVDGNDVVCRVTEGGPISNDRAIPCLG